MAVEPPVVPDPGDGLDPTLPHICDISWLHGGKIDRAAFCQGLVLAFDRDMRAGDIHEQSFRVLLAEERDVTACWCELYVEVKPIQLEEACNADSFSPEDPNVVGGNAPANGAWLQPSQPDLPEGSRLRVVVIGDYVRERLSGNNFGRALDANHLPPWFNAPGSSTQNSGYRSGDGVEGGTFESWFEMGGE